MRRGEKPLLLLIGYRAYGDWLYFVPLLPALFERYEVLLETNIKGYELFHNDPRFKGVSLFEVEKLKNDPYAPWVARRHWKHLIDTLKPDKVINLWRSLEQECIAERHMELFYKDNATRKKELGHKGFRDAVANRLGITQVAPGEQAFYFTPEEEEWGERWRQSHVNDFVIVMPIAGTCAHKFYPYYKQWVSDVLDTYPNAVIYQMGDASLLDYRINHPRVMDAVGNINFKQTIMMARKADYVFGGETGTLVAAGLYGTPKTMLCTASSVYQCVGYDQNDYSLQSSAVCSPCHRAIYTSADCEGLNEREDGEIHPSCIEGFDHDKLLSIVREVYDKKNIYNKEYYDRFVERGHSEIGHQIYQSRWDVIERYCHGNATLLDYGCAAGAFHQSGRNGFQCSGFDVNPYSPHKHEPERTDILTMWDVIEHLKDPTEPIRRYKPEWVFLSTPNKAAAPYKIEEWIHYRPGEHLWYFDLSTLDDILGKLGYSVIEVNFEEGGLRNPERPRDIITIAARRTASVHNNSKEHSKQKDGDLQCVSSEHGNS